VQDRTITDGLPPPRREQLVFTQQKPAGIHYRRVFCTKFVRHCPLLCFRSSRDDGDDDNACCYCGCSRMKSFGAARTASRDDPPGQHRNGGGACCGTASRDATIANSSPATATNGARSAMPPPAVVVNYVLVVSSETAEHLPAAPQPAPRTSATNPNPDTNCVLKNSTIIPN